MGHALGELGRAGAGVGAAQVDVALLGRGERGAARGAPPGHGEVALGAVARLRHRPDDLRDDVPGLAQHDEVADAHALARHLGGVVQGGARDRRPGHEHRLHDPERGDPARAPDLDVDVEQARVDLLGRVLVGGRPSRHAGGVSELGLQGPRVELEDDAVDLVDEVVAVVGVAGDVGLPLGAPAHDRVVGGHRQAPAGEQVVPLVLLARQLLPRRRDDGADAVGDHGKGPCGRHGGVLLAQRAGRGVAGVGEDLQQGPALRLALDVLGAAGLVEGAEVLHGEVDLAADLQQRRVGVPGQDQGHRADGAHVAGDVLADGAVPAGRGPGQHPVLVGQRHGQAVDLDLGGHGQVVIGHLGGRDNALDPLLDLCEAEDVLQGVEVLVVADLGEVGGGAPADRPRGRAGQGQGRVGGLQGLQLAVEGIVLGVGPGALGVDGDVVGVTGALDVAHELAPPQAGRGGNGAEVGGVVGRR